ncbi:hypothetical protein ACHAXR_002608, partial [Thalassiosira sp. AJA248-18]
MRFREYESIPPAAAAEATAASHRHETCLEYHLSDGAANGIKDDGETDKLVWSAATPKKNLPNDFSNAAAKSPKDNLNKGGGISKAVELKIIHIFNKIRQLCLDLFLPIGYPATVADGYIEYQFYDSLQGLCSYLRGVVSTSAVLSATGVGDAEATAMSAAMTWAVRDGLGMIGGLLFSYVASPHFDAHVKEFRLLADILNDIGLTLDMALPLVLTWFSATNTSMLFGSWYSTLSLYLPSPYLVITSVSMLCKVACGMAAGATKGNITDHFATSGNRADCQAKESTQETLVSLVGMCCGVWLAKVLHRMEKVGADSQGIDTCINDDGKDGDGSVIADTCTSNDNKTMVDAQIISWSIFIILTLIHVWANYVGMQMLRLRTLNRERAREALHSLVEDCGQWVLDNQHDNNDNQCTANDTQKTTSSCSQFNATKPLFIDKAISNLLSPESVSESLWKSMCGMVCQGNIQLGISLKDLVRRSSSPTCKWRRGNWSCENENYMIFVEKRKHRNIHSITVMLRLGANDCDELKAFLHAHILNWCMQHEPKFSNALSRSYVVIQSFDLYNILGEKGWDMTRLYLGYGPW